MTTDEYGRLVEAIRGRWPNDRRWTTAKAAANYPHFQPVGFEDALRAVERAGGGWAPSPAKILAGIDIQPTRIDPSDCDHRYAVASVIVTAEDRIAECVRCGHRKPAGEGVGLAARTEGGWTTRPLTVVDRRTDGPSYGSAMTLAGMKTVAGVGTVEDLIRRWT